MKLQEINWKDKSKLTSTFSHCGHLVYRFSSRHLSMSSFTFHSSSSISSKVFFLQRNSDVTLQIIIRRWSSFVFSKHIVQAFKERKDLLSYLLGRTNCTISLERYEKSIESIKGSSSIMLMMFGDKSKVALGQCCEIMAKVQLAS